MSALYTPKSDYYVPHFCDKPSTLSLPRGTIYTCSSCGRYWRTVRVTSTFRYWESISKWRGRMLVRRLLKAGATIDIQEEQP